MRAKFAATPKSKPNECRDAQHLVKATEGVFMHASLNYAFQVRLHMNIDGVVRV